MESSLDLIQNCNYSLLNDDELSQTNGGAVPLLLAYGIYAGVGAAGVATGYYINKPSKKRKGRK